MHERPQAALFQALRELGYRVDSENNRLPAVVHGGGPRPGRCKVSVDESSQFASALILSARQGGWQIEVQGSNADELPYVQMTSSLLQSFPAYGGVYQIEPDSSSGSYFIAADALLRSTGRGRVEVADWPSSDWQVDSAFPRYLPLRQEISRKRDLGDSIMTAMILAPFAAGPVRFTDLGRLRVQECERVAAMKTEMGKCGVRVEESGDTLEIWPSAGLRGAEVETYDDHRVAMVFATLGLVIPGIRLRNPGCVRKTFPNFFQKMAAPAPHGLGVTILDGTTGRPLTVEALHAG
jgi:3-phosphoshikimate 1-carboxyvinyltransferase